jgi:PAS domain S-box-containing protein
MRDLPRSGYVRLGLPILLAVVVGVFPWLSPSFFGPASYLLALGGVVIAARFGGLVAGLLTALLYLPIHVHLVAKPVGSFGIAESHEYLKLAFFLVLSGVVSWLIEALHAAERATRAHHAALRASEERYRCLLDTAQEGICLVDAQGAIVYANERLAKLLHYHPKELTGHPLWNLMDPESRTSAAQAWQRQQPGSYQHHDCRFRCKDGSDLWAQVSTGPGYQGDDSSAHMLVMLTDISKRKRAEDTLRFLVDAGQVLASSLDYESTLSSVARLAVPALADWCTVDVLEEDGSLRRLATVHSEPDKERLVLELRRRLPPDGRETATVRQVLHTGRPQLLPEITAERLQQTVSNPERLRMLQQLGVCSAMIVPLRARGRTLGAVTLVAAESGRRFDDDDLIVAEALARRATLAVDNALLYREAQRELAERRQVEEHLRNQQKWLQSTLDLMPTPTLFVEPRTAQVTFANKAAQELAGGALPIADSIDSYFTDASGARIPADQLPTSRVAQGERLEKLELNWHLAGQTRSLLLYGDTIPAQYGHPTTGVIKFQDISQLKEVEAELRRTNKAKDEFLAMLGHELRNPLAPLLNALHIFRLSKPPSETLQQTMEMAERQVRHLARLVDDLLDVSRITRGKIKLRKENVELAAVVRGAVETSQPLINEREQQLVVSLPPDEIQLEGDATRLEQVLANLLNNAAKYSEPGGKIELCVTQKGAEAVVRVRDTGIGIPADVLPHIFDMFVQAERSLDRSQGGLGLGLTLVQRLVGMHGGSVMATSAGPGQGSEFIVRLPALPASQDRLALSRTVKLNGRHLRILVVDDNRDAAQSLAIVLRAWGHEVEIALNGNDALDTAGQFRPQVVLLDIGMPRMSGYEVAQHLRRLSGLGAALLLVAMTGFGTEEDQQRSREAGFDCHLLKPVDPTELEEILSRPGQATPK